METPSLDRILDAELEERGIRCVGQGYFGAPQGTTEIAVPSGDCEARSGPQDHAWELTGARFVAAQNAPQGGSYLRLAVKQGNRMRLSRIAGVPGKPHFISFWLRTSGEHCVSIGGAPAAGGPITYAGQFLEPVHTSNGGKCWLPSTAGEWKRVGYYFWVPPHAGDLNFTISTEEDDAAGAEDDGRIEIDDVRLRTATEGEMRAAYASERMYYPVHEVAPGPQDGSNLALSVAKWEGSKGIPGRPFVIWALGSSFTAFLLNGYPLVDRIRERFPVAPPVIYKRLVGSGTPWEYVHGWIRQVVIPEQPDLVFIYTNGDLERLDELLGDLRRHTTADVIVPSLHFFQRDRLADIKRGGVAEDALWNSAGEVCRRHGVEYVDSRRELADYLQRNDLEPERLLYDVCHQNAHGYVRIWGNVARHISKPRAFSYDPSERERRVPVVAGYNSATERVSLHGGWQVDDGAVRTRERGAKIVVRFTGNRIDLIGRKVPGGGAVRVLLDGAPGERVPVFYTSYIEAKPRSLPLRLKGPGAHDIAPHAVGLGENITPQTWVITMTSDMGDYRLDGSSTGFDGEGNCLTRFVSNSGQICIEPRFWRHRQHKQQDGETIYGNRAGDAFSFSVYRCAVGCVGFGGDAGEPLHQPLVQHLTNGVHTLEIESQGDGEVAIGSFYVFQPPEH